MKWNARNVLLGALAVLLCAAALLSVTESTQPVTPVLAGGIVAIIVPLGVSLYLHKYRFTYLFLALACVAALCSVIVSLDAWANFSAMSKACTRGGGVVRYVDLEYLCEQDGFSTGSPFALNSDFLSNAAMLAYFAAFVSSLGAVLYLVIRWLTGYAAKSLRKRRA